MSENKGRVYICHHVDTEGPLWEEITELFITLKKLYKIDLSPSKQNLENIRQNTINLPLEDFKELSKMIDPHILDYKNNWGAIDPMLDNIMSTNFRNKMIDSNNNGWIYNWNTMCHVGFEENPRHRDMGYLNIFNYYEQKIKETSSYMDAIHWHFHPIPFSKKAHMVATSYDNSMYELHQVICRRIIEKSWFPRVNRAGFHAERIDSNFFLEQWIPFDPSNQAIDYDENNGIYNLLADWSGAPSDWTVYHPDIYDWRKKGQCNRVIARILNMRARVKNINEDEIEKAFIKAQSGEHVYLGITNHDYREMSTEIDDFRALLKNVIDRFPNVDFEFSESVHAFRKVLGFDDDEIIKNRLKFSSEILNNTLTVSIKNGDFFGPQPYLAIKTTNGCYVHDNFDFHNTKNTYSYIFNDANFDLKSISKIAIASNDKYGTSCINIISLNNGIVITNTISYLD
jgi:hypothetical protein